MKDSYLAQFYGKSQNYTDIPNKWYKEYNVKKGLRNEDGTGVRVGLTRVADVVGYDETPEGGIQAIPGKLYYRGYDVEDLVKGKGDSHFGYEEVCFLLLFGYLPKKAELEHFRNILTECYEIPDEFVEMNLLRMPGRNLMNKLQDAVLTLYNYDDDPDNTDVYETLVKGINLMAKLPSIACYAYQSKVHYYNRDSLFIHYANPKYSIAENFLSLLRKDQKFSDKEARLLDTILMLHADHGGGNNSTFTNVVISSTGTDIYSTVCGSIGSMKGPRHGGANIKVAEMMDAVLEETGGYTVDDKKIKTAVNKLMDGELYDRSGLVYGFGHAVYTISDPRAEMLRARCLEVAKEKKMMTEFDFRQRFERIALETMKERKGVALPTNVDYYSGFAYEMLGIPRDLYTPLFVCSRMVGWVAHNIENKLYDGRIMRPATKYVGDNKAAKQIGKININAEILAVGVDVLSEKGNLSVACGNQFAQLFFDLLRVSRTLSAADIRHDTVGTEIVAAVHDREPGLCTLRAKYRQSFCNIILAADIKYALSVRQYAIKQRRKTPQRMRTEQQIDLRIALFNLFNILFLLRHAAAQRDDDIRPLLLEMAQRADVAEGTILRMLAHCTGVEQDEIRLFRAACHFISHFMQHAANAFGIRLILLAAKGMRIGFEAFAAIQTGNSVNISELRLQLLLGNILLCGQFYASLSR